MRPGAPTGAMVTEEGTGKCGLVGGSDGAGVCQQRKWLEAAVGQSAEGHYEGVAYESGHLSVEGSIR